MISRLFKLLSTAFELYFVDNNSNNNYKIYPNTYFYKKY